MPHGRPAQSLTAPSPAKVCAIEGARLTGPSVEPVQARIPTTSAEAVRDLDALALRITANARDAVLNLEHLRCFVQRVESLEKPIEQNVRYVQ